MLHFILTRFKEDSWTNSRRFCVLFWKYGELPYACYGQEADGVPVCATLPGNDQFAITRANGALIYLKVQDGSFVKQVTVAKKSTGNMVARGNVIATYSEKNLVIVKDSDVKTIALRRTKMKKDLVDCILKIMRSNL